MIIKKATWLFTIAFIVLIIFLPGYSKLQDLRQKNRDLQKRIEELKQENISLKHYLNIKTVARRTTNSMWFRAPSQIYYNQHSLENLRTLESKTAMIITTPGQMAKGHVDLVKRNMPQVPVIHIYEDITPEPPYQEVMRAVEHVKEYKPDTIIALGGGSVLDAAKAIRFFYEHPSFDFRLLKIVRLTV